MVEYQEDTITSKVAEIINNIIKEEKLPFKGADVQVRDSKGLRPDLIIKDLQNQVHCVWESKRPFIAVMQPSLYSKALLYASNESVPYFVTFNLRGLVLWKTFDPHKRLEQRRMKIYKVSSRVKKLEDIDRADVKKNLRKALRMFLIDLANTLKGKEDEILPTLSIDNVLIEYLRDVIHAVEIPLSDSLKN